MVRGISAFRRRNKLLQLSIKHGSMLQPDTIDLTSCFLDFDRGSSVSHGVKLCPGGVVVRALDSGSRGIADSTQKTEISTNPRVTQL